MAEATLESIPAPFELHADEKFSHHQQTRLYELQQSSSLTDFTVRVGEHSLPCHQVVLAAVCPYFDAMLRTGMEEAKKAEVQLDCLDWGVVEEIVKYCYTGNISVKHDSLEQLVAACDFLQLNELKSLGEKHIISKLSVNNCIGWFKLAAIYRMKSLLEAAEHMMCSQFIEVCDCDEFKDLSLAEVIDYIRNEKIEVHSENAVLSAVLDWVVGDKDNRKQELADVLKHISLQNCTASYLHLITATHKDLFDCENVHTHVYKALWDLALGHEQVQRKTIGRAPPQETDTVILLCGGFTRNGISSDCMYYSDNSWNTLKDIQVSANLESSSICMTQEGIWVTGGKPVSPDADRCQLYDFRAHSWIVMPNMLSKRHGHGTAVVGEYLYLIGGETQGTLIETVEAMSLVNGKWKHISSLIHSVCYPILAVLDMCIYVIFNNCKGNKEAEKKHGITLQICDTIKNKWKYGANLPVDANFTGGASAVVADKMIYLVGGAAKLCNRYDPSTNTWTILTPPPNVHLYGSAVLVNGRLLILGGSTDGSDVVNSICDTISEYDVVNNSWSTADFKCPYPVRWHFVSAAPLSLLM